jgi:hypothetical protein
MVLRNIIDSMAPSARTRRGLLTPGDRVRLLDHLAVQVYDRAGGQICLYGPHYFDRWRRLWVQHTRCGNWFWVSVAELIEGGHAGACPHCNPVTDLSRFGTIENLRQLVYSRGQLAVEIFTNYLGSSRKRYIFFCRAHRRLYLARFDDFLRNAGGTNGCPDCEARMRSVGPKE